MSERPMVKIAEIARQISIGPFGSRMKSDRYVSAGVPVIRGTNLTGGRKFSGNWVYVSEQTADELGNCCVSSGDLVFPHRGAIGEVGIVTEEFSRYVMSSSLMKLSCDLSKVVPTYVYYFFKSTQGKHELLKNASQVGTPGIGQPLSSLKAIEIPLPPLSVQRDIARILGDLDDKIELNRHINQTLEQIAQAIFKSWFVDFEPVKAKIQAKQNGQNPERAAMCAISGKTEEELDQLPAEQLQQLATTSALFPDELEGSELGEIPKGWKLSSFGSIAENIRLGVDPANESPETPYVGLEHIERKHIYLSTWGRAEHVDSNKSKFSAGDVLFGKLRPYFHKVCFVPFGGVSSTDILVIRSRHDDWLGFVQFHLFAEKFVEYANARSTGTRMPRATWKDMAQYPFAKPPRILAATYNIAVKNFNELAGMRIQESANLATLRDTLLPKLLSGEITVHDTQNNIEAVA